MVLSGLSKKVTSPCTELLLLLEPESVKTRLEQLLETVQHNRGEDINFLDRCDYDGDQRKAIGDSIIAIAESQFTNQKEKLICRPSTNGSSTSPLPIGLKMY